MSDPVDDRPTGAMRTVMQKAASTMLKASSKATNAWVSRIRPEVDTSLFVEADTVTKLLDIPPARSGLDYATAFRVATHTPETFTRARRIYEAMRNPLAEQVQNLGAAMQRGESSASDRLPQARARLEEFDDPTRNPAACLATAISHREQDETDALVELSRYEIAAEALDHPLIAKFLANAFVERGDLDEADVWLGRALRFRPLDRELLGLARRVRPPEEHPLLDQLEAVSGSRDTAP